MLRRPSLSRSPAEVPLGVVPRMRRPRGARGPATGHDVAARGPDDSTAGRVPRGRGTALDRRIEHHLARMQGTAQPTSPGTIDDDRARRDPDTAPFAAVRPDDAGSPSPARVATAADRPRTAAFPVVTSTD